VVVTLLVEVIHLSPIHHHQLMALKELPLVVLELMQLGMLLLLQTPIRMVP